MTEGILEITLYACPLPFLNVARSGRWWVWVLSKIIFHILCRFIENTTRIKWKKRTL